MKLAAENAKLTVHYIIYVSIVYCALV